MTQTTATFEAGVNGNNVTNGAGEASTTAWNTVDALGGPITYDNTHKYDTLAAKIVLTGSGSETSMQWGAALGTVTDQYGRAYIWLNALPTGSAIRLVQGYSGGSTAFRIDVNTAGTIALLDNVGLVQTTSTAVATGQWVRLEWHVVHSLTVGQIELKLFNSPDSATPTETSTTSANRNTQANCNLITFGNSNGAAATATFWIDNIVAGAASYPGPVAVASTGATRSLLGVGS